MGTPLGLKYVPYAYMDPLDLRCVDPWPPSPVVRLCATVPSSPSPQFLPAPAMPQYLCSSTALSSSLTGTTLSPLPLPQCRHVTPFGLLLLQSGSPGRRVLVARAFIKNGHFTWNSFPSALSWLNHSSSAFPQPPLHHRHSCDFASGQPSIPHRPFARTFFFLFGEGGPVLPALVWPRPHFSGRELFGPF